MMLTDDNIIDYMEKSYHSMFYFIEEHKKVDFRMPVNVRIRLKKYKITGKIDTNLVLNLIITTINLFGNKEGVHILYFYCDEYKDLLSSFMVQLNLVYGKTEIYDEELLSSIRLNLY